jgi:hypothetical protein
MDKRLMDIQTKGAAQTSQEGLGSRIVEKVKSLNPLSGEFDFAKAGNTIKDLGGKALNAVFRDKDGNLDKAAIMAALITVPTFLEARGIANEAGLSEEEFTEDMFNAAKSDSKQTYESNLGSFFEGTGYTGNLAKGGLIRKKYAYGDDDPSQYPEEESDITIFELMKDQGIPVGEQTKGKIKQGAQSILMAEGTGLSSEQESMINDMSIRGADISLMQEIIGVEADKIRNFIKSQNKGKMAKGGRIGFDSGGNEDINFIHRNKIRRAIEDAEKMGFDMNEVTEDASEYNGKGLHSLTQFFKNEKIRKALINQGHDPNKIMREFLVEQMKSETGDLPSDSRGYSELFRKGGRVNYALGTPQAGEGGLGGLPVEADMRYTGGFMPYGEKERGDDVPARLSKNEFVFTADAVRAAGGGSMQKGAQRMYNTMKSLEGRAI